MNQSLMSCIILRLSYRVYVLVMFWCRGLRLSRIEIVISSMTSLLANQLVVSESEMCVNVNSGQSAVMTRRSN